MEEVQYRYSPLRFTWERKPVSGGKWEACSPEELAMLTAKYVKPYGGPA